MSDRVKGATSIPWRPEEDEVLLAGLAKGLRRCLIAGQLNRSESSVNGRARTLWKKEGLGKTGKLAAQRAKDAADARLRRHKEYEARERRKKLFHYPKSTVEEAKADVLSALKNSALVGSGRVQEALYILDTVGRPK